MTQREILKLARIIFQSTWGVTGFTFSTRRKDDWQSRDAVRAAQTILTHFELKPRAVGECAPTSKEEKP